MRILFFTVILWVPFYLHAQVMDPSLLMFAPTKGPTVESTETGDLPLENSYYIRKKKTAKKRAPATDVIEKSNDGDEDESSAQAPGPKKEEPKPIVLILPEDNFEFPITDEGPQNLGKKVRNSFLGGDLELIDSYRQRLKSSLDIRKNIFEFSVAPQYFYNTSQSNYFYRNYNHNGPAIEGAADLWLTPFLGINVDYETSLLDAVSDSPTQNSLASVNEQTLNFGLKFRRFFSNSPNSSSVTVGLDYTDRQFQAPVSDAYRMSTRNRGLLFLFDFALPVTRHYLWNFGLKVAPVLSNEETPGLTNFTSGQSGQALSFGGYLGGEYRFTRRIQTFFKFSAEVYRNRFSGNASALDPLTSNAISNVTVNDVTYFFSLGVRFGR